ncbi:hypothetical protein ACFL6U_09185 [Planctomycetota bacterium]
MDITALMEQARSAVKEPLAEREQITRDIAVLAEKIETEQQAVVDLGQQIVKHKSIQMCITDFRQWKQDLNELQRELLLSEQAVEAFTEKILPAKQTRQRECLGIIQNRLDAVIRANKTETEIEIWRCLNAACEMRDSFVAMCDSIYRHFGASLNHTSDILPRAEHGRVERSGKGYVRFKTPSLEERVSQQNQYTKQIDSIGTKQLDSVGTPV